MTIKYVQRKKEESSSTNVHWKRLFRVDVASELYLISCQTCKTISTGTNKTSHGSKYIQWEKTHNHVNILIKRLGKISHWMTLGIVGTEGTFLHLMKIIANIVHLSLQKLKTVVIILLFFFFRRETSICKASTLTYHSSVVLTKIN